MNNNKTILLFLLSILLTFGCKKNSTDPEGTNVQTPGVGKDQVSFSGIVHKEDGYPLANIEINFDGNLLRTDQNGYYSYNGKVKDADKVVVKFTRAGCFDDYRTYVLQTGAVTKSANFYFKAELRAGSFQNSIGGKVIKENDSYTFQPNSVVRQDNSAYTGEVIIVYYPVHTTLAGDARGVDKTNQKVALETYDGIVVKLKSPAGEYLKLSKPMSLSFYAGWNSQNSAPRTNKLWVYNETDNIWVENSNVTLDGDYYIGETTALGHLQFAKPSAPTLLKATIKDVVNNAPVHFFIKHLYQQAAINSNGIAQVYIPTTNNWNKTVVSLFTTCEEFVENFELPEGALPLNLIQNYTAKNLLKFTTEATGQVLDCDFKGINGRAEFNFDGVIYSAPIVNGIYKVKTFSCSNAGVRPTITIYDASNRLLKPTEDFTRAKGSMGTAADISVCSRPISGYFTINAQGKTFTFTAPADIITNIQLANTSVEPFTTIWCDNGKAAAIAITTAGKSVGSFKIGTLDGFIPGIGRLTIFTDGAGTINISKYKTGNTILEGTFSGNANLNATYEKVDFTGSFKIDQ